MDSYNKQSTDARNVLSQPHPGINELCLFFLSSSNYYIKYDRKRKTIWKFEDNKWSIIYGYVLEQLISEFLINEIKECKSELDDNDKIKYLDILHNKLMLESFKSKLHRELLVFFDDDEFYNKLDTNVNLLACRNGILDFKTKEFRQGTPSDIISCSNRLIFNNNLTSDSTEIKEFEEILSKTFPISEDKDKFLDTFSSIMQGKINHHVIIFRGGYSSGKSFILCLLRFIFGEHYLRLPSCMDDHSSIIHKKRLIEYCEDLDDNENSNIYSYINKYIEHSNIIVPCTQTLKYFNEAEKSKRATIIEFRSHFIGGNNFGPFIYSRNTQLTNENKLRDCAMELLWMLFNRVNN